MHNSCGRGLVETYLANFSTSACVAPVFLVLWLNVAMGVGLRLRFSVVLIVVGEG